MRHTGKKRWPWQHFITTTLLYCQCKHIDLRRYKSKVRKFHFIVLCRFGVIEESSRGEGGGIPHGIHRV